eukprot:1081371_1
MALCFLFNVILGYLLIHTISAANVLPAHLGFAVSTGFQSAPLTPSQIGVITSSYILSDTKHYKFFGWPSDHDIAVGILNASSSPQDITFYIGFQTPITQLDISHLEALAAEWDDVKENVYCVALVNEPDYNSVDFSILPAKLNMTSSFFQSKSQWNHVVVSIPFSTLIFAKTWPVPESEFLEEHKPYLSQIIDIYKQYGAPFSINLYPFYVAPHEPTLMGYILGEEPAEYPSMFVAQYMALWYAMEALSPTNGLDIVVTETGWSTFSSNPTYAFATLENAQIYYDNTFQQMKDVQSEVYGVRVYAFELFDEDQKGGSNLHWEANWGVFDVHAELKWNLLNETTSPTAIPSIGPSKAPSDEPSTAPSKAPSSEPSRTPSNAPTKIPSVAPTKTPSVAPTDDTMDPTTTPSDSPSKTPSVVPSKTPSVAPTKTPSVSPSRIPSDATMDPTTTPSNGPSKAPTVAPSKTSSSEPSMTPSTVPNSMEPIVTDAIAGGSNCGPGFMICIFLMVIWSL